ncbi:MAG: cation diffusion facilitator family transporter [Chitinophagales bacterium]|nr:cation diffusion facilitator family transporter [Chitinophagales bacterium]
MENQFILNKGKKKTKFQWLILGASILVFLAKMLAFYFTNSVSILSDALESIVNITTSIMTLQALKYALKPRDEDHPYGHGKIELLTASVEGILIAVAGVLIVIEAINRLNHPPIIQDIGLGIIILMSTSLINYILGMFSIKKGKNYGSISLISEGKHLQSDAYSTFALIGGLLLYMATGHQWMDSLLAISFGLFILYTGYQVLKDTVTGLMDEADPIALNRIVNVIKLNKRPTWVNIHKLTLLRFGQVYHIDMHLTLPYHYTVEQAHQETTFLKSIIRKEFEEEELDISIQSEPCRKENCPKCKDLCILNNPAYDEEKVWSIEQITGKNNLII